MRFSFSSSGSFNNTEKFLKSLQKIDIPRLLAPYGEKGVRALQEHTPKDSGLAAKSWYYRISDGPKGFAITWCNNDVETGFPVAIMLQYGYATGTGGYVQGRDYINPAMRPIFDDIRDAIWREVTKR